MLCYESAWDQWIWSFEQERFLLILDSWGLGMLYYPLWPWEHSYAYLGNSVRSLQCLYGTHYQSGRHCHRQVQFWCYTTSRGIYVINNSYVVLPNTFLQYSFKVSQSHLNYVIELVFLPTRVIFCPLYYSYAMYIVGRSLLHSPSTILTSTHTHTKYLWERRYFALSHLSMTSDLNILMPHVLHSYYTHSWIYCANRINIAKFCTVSFTSYLPKWFSCSWKTDAVWCKYSAKRIFSSRCVPNILRAFC